MLAKKPPRPRPGADFYTLHRPHVPAPSSGGRPMPRLVNPIAFHLHDHDNAPFKSYVVAFPKSAYASQFWDAWTHFKKANGEQPPIEWCLEDDGIAIDWMFQDTKDYLADTDSDDEDASPLSPPALRGWTRESLQRFCSYHWLNLIVVTLDLENPKITLVDMETDREKTNARLKQMMRIRAR